MESCSTPRGLAKLETFEPAAIRGTEHEREITRDADEATINVKPQETGTGRDDREVLTVQDDSERGSPPNASVQANAATSMTLTPLRLPAILDGEFFTVIRVEESNVTVRCLECQKLLNGNLKSTGNFLSHIKRVHPFMIDKIKCKSNQRKPAIAYIDQSMEKSTEIVRTKKGYRKCYKADDSQMVESPASWSDSPLVRRRKYDETIESPEMAKLPQNNSFIMEDEFDAIGRNVAAKLRNMRLDQRIIAEKLLNDVLFEAQLGTLHRDSNLHV